MPAPLVYAVLQVRSCRGEWMSGDILSVVAWLIGGQECLWNARSSLGTLGPVLDTTPLFYWCKYCKHLLYLNTSKHVLLPQYPSISQAVCYRGQKGWCWRSWCCARGRRQCGDTDPHEFYAVVQRSFPSEKQKEVLIIRQDHICKLDKKHFKKSPQQQQKNHTMKVKKRKNLGSCWPSMWNIGLACFSLRNKLQTKGSGQCNTPWVTSSTPRLYLPDLPSLLQVLITERIELEGTFEVIQSNSSAMGRHIFN